MNRLHDSRARAWVRTHGWILMQIRVNLRSWNTASLISGLDGAARIFVFLKVKIFEELLVQVRLSEEYSEREEIDVFLGFIEHSVYGRLFLNEATRKQELSCPQGTDDARHFLMIACRASCSEYR